MKKVTWWLRIVGGFYILLTLMNLGFLFLSPEALKDTLPAPMSGDPLAVRAFADAWLVFVFELGALGAAMLYASRKPERSGALILAIILAEIFRGIVADAIWIARGYAAASYLPFIVIHTIIIVTGILFWRQEAGKSTRSPAL
jgi:hypothetical protein